MVGGSFMRDAIEKACGPDCEAPWPSVKGVIDMRWMAIPVGLVALWKRSARYACEKRGVMRGPASWLGPGSNLHDQERSCYLLSQL